MDNIKIKVNGVQHTVGSEVSSDVMLVDYLRNFLELRGTKYSCREGGCGACIVTASKTPGTPYVSVNSCLVAVTSCDGWDIRTIEGLGNKKDGYHKVQTTLAENHGSQCGYCSCGWVMAMQGVLETKKDLTMKEIENSFGSNLCRCTGYRPIIEAFKKFAKDAPKEERIMDLQSLYICNKNGNKCCSEKEDDWCMVEKNDTELESNKVKELVLKDGRKWFQAKRICDIFDILAREGTDSYMLVAGNTAKGAIPIDEYPKILIDINNVQSLKTIETDQNVILGGALTLTEFMDVLKSKSSDKNFSYFTKFYNHMDLVAHIPVRNVGTIAGNLMIKHGYNMYPSDVFLLFDAVGAELTIGSRTEKFTVTMDEFLKLDMKGKLIINVMLPPLNEDYLLYTYKLMSRAQSAHSIVNAGFLYKIDRKKDVIEKARVVFGHLSSTFIRARATESYLVGKRLFENETVQGALGVLDGEMLVEDNPPEPSVEFRRYLAKALMFKGILSLCPSSTRGQRLSSGAINIRENRPVTTSRQVYESDPKMWPLNQPIAKVEATVQCAGEALYTEDIPALPREVFASFVLSTVALGTIVKIDASAALKYPGVVAFYTAKDIPGLNSFTPHDSLFYTANEEILCDGNVKFYHQPIGIIVAETQHVADRASKLVVVKYSNVRKPVIDIKEAVKDESKNTLHASAEATNPGTDVYKTITGSNTFYGQCHFPLESIVCVAKPIEEGLEIHAATQWLDGVHTMVSRALNLGENKIDVHVRRIGGGYGLKISRSIQSAVACSLVAHKLNRPCRFIMSLSSILKSVGKRFPCHTTFEAAVNSSGQLQYLNAELYEDNGYKTNEMVSTIGMDVYNNCYDKSKINFKYYDSITDMPKNTFCRSPGSMEAITNMECIMEQISYELSMDPVAVRLANLDHEQYGEMAKMVEEVKVQTDYVPRRAAVDSFNAENRWKKRGLRWAFARWAPIGAQHFDLNLAVYHADGTVAITHAGVEMGQGINTKAIQLTSYLLKIPIEKIQVKANSTVVTPNSFMSGGSLTTSSIIIGLRKCCAELNARLEPFRASLENPTWEELITAAYGADVDLQTHGFTGFGDAQVYDVYGMALCEVELDVLTAEYEILRVDMIQDVGVSLNPDIDIGQVEGAFIMGLGYWTCEKLVYTEEGENLTNRAWDYHLPVSKDIPQDFRIYLKKNSYSNERILGSKGTGEPPICASVVVPFAIREAITQARKEAGIPSTEWFQIDGPFSGEKVYKSLRPNVKDFRLY
ncbi:xanthine dehydrogenase/oxidase-like isoform X2 [Trichoplusia ni]|uniref:Xanthine dehydrogenase/oxidase-like isoform X2 n=2 Tax=Trichoplusia ni TaxID=7111 RepID=A0A7E5WLF6_TRINI|nr:xanthine dehydrogenase/oxidase-like isoform X2 [Trichoplusia ni]